jgi:hypothetical protein
MSLIGEPPTFRPHFRLFAAKIPDQFHQFIKADRISESAQILKAWAVNTRLLACASKKCVHHKISRACMPPPNRVIGRRSRPASENGLHSPGPRSHLVRAITAAHAEDDSLKAKRFARSQEHIDPRRLSNIRRDYGNPATFPRSRPAKYRV